MEENLEIFGARVHNLKNIDLVIPRYKFVVFTGLSGSGKSSLAFDTIYAEGQRRYMETFSAYARQFIGNLERPDVDKINGLSPVIAIEQKTGSRNPRSTVGTITEIYDFLRLLFARVADAYSYVTGEKMVRYNEQQIVELILSQFKDKTILILAPMVKGRKGHYRELFEQIRKQGFLKVRIDGKIQEITHGLQLDRYKVHDIETVIDQISIKPDSKARLTGSVDLAMHQGKDILMVYDTSDDRVRHFSRLLMCPTSGISYEEPEPNTFSFNSPYGACPKCNGLGTISEIDINKIIPDRSKSIRKGGITPLGEYKNNWIFKQMEAIGEKYDFDLNTPIAEIPDTAINVILYGSDEIFRVKNDYLGITSTYALNFEGIVSFINSQQAESAPSGIMKWISNFMNKSICPECHGNRLKKESLHFKIGDLNIADLSNMDLKRLNEWFSSPEKYLDKRKMTIAYEIIREIRNRIRFLLDVGIGYLTLNRPARSLSGGESQRIRLATQIGSQLVGVLYILDEPSIGLHQHDNMRLVNALKNLRDTGNSVIVVEHDKETILAADYVVDIGPGAGVHGGRIVIGGTPEGIMHSGSLTGDYLIGRKSIEIPEKRRHGNGKFLTIHGASGNNLKHIDLVLPLGKFICVTGLSGSGKSSLIDETLYPILSRHFYKSEQNPLPFASIDGIKNIDKVVEVDQSPIGRTPRSNPVTYTKVFDEIRKLFAELPESKIRDTNRDVFHSMSKVAAVRHAKGPVYG